MEEHNVDDGLNSTRREPVPPKPGESELRTQTLKDMLKYELKEEDLVPAVRELARIVLNIYENVSTLPEIRAGIASTQRLVLDFLADQLQARRSREAQELEIANIAAQKAGEKLKQTNEKIKRINFPITYEQDKSPHPPQSSAEKAWIWFRDKVLPYFATGLSIVILQAVWEYFKTQVNSP